MRSVRLIRNLMIKCNVTDYELRYSEKSYAVVKVFEKFFRERLFAEASAARYFFHLR